MTISKRLCNVCRSSATKKGETYTAIAWRCPVCLRGSCRHVPSYPIKNQRVCSDCLVAHLDEEAIKKSEKSSKSAA
jgi:hypothetical protein